MWVFIGIILLILASYEIINIPSSQTRGIWGGVLVILFFMVFQSYLVVRANTAKKNADVTGPRVTFFNLIVTSEDNRYSLSRFQIYIWTVWLAAAFAQVAFATMKLPVLDTNMAALMGVNGFTAALSTAMSDPQKLALRKADTPNFFSDLFLDKNGTLDLPRTQVFVWTLIILTGHMIIFFKGYDGNSLAIPTVDTGLLILMGVSNGAYLGVKAASDKK